MHAYILIGVLISICGASLGLVAFFIRAWMRRRSDSEYFIFGLITLCLACNTALTALGYYQAVHPDADLSVRLLLDGLALTSKVALPLLLHFAVRYARLEKEWRIMVPAYGLTVIFIAMIFAGVWWAEVPNTFTTQRVFGIDIPQLAVRVTPPAYLFYVMVVVVCVVVVGLLARTVLRGRREGRMALVGAIVLAATMANDAALGTGMFPSVPLIPVGYLALALGTSLTLVSRYGRLSVELRQRSEALRASLERLRASYQQLEQTQQELVKSEQLAVVGELAAVIAHEVRNPLAVVSNAVASLRKSATSSEDRTLLLVIIDEEMTRLDKLVGQLLNYARPVVPELEQVDLRSVLDRGMALVSDQAGLRSQLEIDPDVPLINADPNLLRQAFDNVIANAAQAVGDDGKLEVFVRRMDMAGVDSVNVRFEDDGPGMAEEVRAQAFSPFFTTRSTGTGLGLAIVERIISAHDGTVVITSEPGQGTTVSVTLPRNRE